MAKDSIDAAIDDRDRIALMDAVAIANGMSVSQSASGVLEKSMATAALVLPYLQLRASKPNHATWSCAEVRTAFDALAHVHNLAADTSATVTAYFDDETVDGALLPVLASDADLLKEVVPNSLRRHRLTAVLSEICADPVGAANVPVAVKAAVGVKAPVAVAVPMPAAVAVAAAGAASPHSVSAAASSSSEVHDEHQPAVSPVCARF